MEPGGPGGPGGPGKLSPSRPASPWITRLMSFKKDTSTDLQSWYLWSWFPFGPHGSLWMRKKALSRLVKETLALFSAHLQQKGNISAD